MPILINLETKGKQTTTKNRREAQAVADWMPRKTYKIG